MLDPRVRLTRVERFLKGIGENLGTCFDIITIENVKKKNSYNYIYAFNEKYRIGTIVSPTPSLSNTFTPPSSSWENIISLTGFWSNLSSSSSTRNKLKKLFRSKFYCIDFERARKCHNFNKFYTFIILEVTINNFSCAL